MIDLTTATLVRYGGDIAAVIDAQRVLLTPCYEALGRDHPIRRFVTMKCLVAAEMQAGPDAEPYDDARADFYARWILMPDEEFDRVSPAPDPELAARFAVPLEQIDAKRYDRAFLRPASPARRRRVQGRL